MKCRILPVSKSYKYTEVIKTSNPYKRNEPVTQTAETRHSIQLCGVTLHDLSIDYQPPACTKSVDKLVIKDREAY